MAKTKAAPEPNGGAAKTSKTAPKGGKVAKKEAKPKKEKTEPKPRDHIPQNPAALPRLDPSDSQEDATQEDHRVERRRAQKAARGGTGGVSFFLFTDCWLC